MTTPVPGGSDRPFGVRIQRAKRSGIKPACSSFVPVLRGPSGEPVALGARTGRRYWVCVPEVAEFWWMARGTTLSYAPAHGGAPSAVQDALESAGIPLYLHTVLGFEALHASAVVTREGVVALCGPTGFGKSTLAHGLGDRGNLLWADDVVAFKATAGGVVTTALPFTPNLRPASKRYFLRAGTDARAPQPRVATAWSERSLVAAVALLPRRASSRAQTSVRMERLGAADALAAILPHGLRFQPADAEQDRRIAAAYATLVSHVPVFRLTYRRGFAVLPDVLDRLDSMIRAIPEPHAST